MRIAIRDCTCNYNIQCAGGGDWGNSNSPGVAHGSQPLDSYAQLMHTDAYANDSEYRRTPARSRPAAVRNQRKNSLGACRFGGADRARSGKTPGRAWRDRAEAACGSQAALRDQMILVDTSVWIDHFRRNEPGLAALLSEASVLTHPFVLGELTCGNLRNRAVILRHLETLPGAVPATHNEVLRLIEDRKLWGRGIGWIDAHLLASALLSSCVLWTRDESLDQAATQAEVKLYRGA